MHISMTMLCVSPYFNWFPQTEVTTAPPQCHILKLNYVQIFSSQLQENSVHIHHQYWSSNAVEGNDLQCVNYMKHMNAMWEDGKFIITAGDAYSYHWVLNG